MLFDHYDPPAFVKQDTFVTGRRSNITMYSKKWLDYFQEQVNSQRTDNILVMWGGDFSHQNGETYNALDEIMEGLREAIEQEPGM